MKRTILSIILLAGTLASTAQIHSLEECLKMAAQNNRTLKSQRIDIEKAQADKRSAFMNYLPKVDATAMGFVSANDLIDGKLTIDDDFKAGLMQDPTIGGIISQQPQQIQMALAGLKEIQFNMLDKGFTAAVTIMQPIYAGGQIINGNRLAELGIDVKQLQYKMNEREVMQNVTQYYWGIQSLRGSIKTLDAVDKQLTELHKQVDQYVKAGVTNRNDLLTVELKQQEMASNRLKINNGLMLSEMVLAQLVGADPATFHADEATTYADNAPASYYEDTEAAVAQRTEVALTQKAVEASRLQLKMEQGKNLPSVAIGAAGMYYAMGGNVGQQTNLTGQESTVGKMKMSNLNVIGMATVSIPISSWWSRKHDINKAKSNLLQAELTRQETEEKLHIDVQNAWNALNEAYAQIEIARKSVESSNENLRLNRDYYNVGQTNMSDLLDAYTLYTKSANTLTEALANYQIKLADYLRKVK